MMDEGQLEREFSGLLCIQRVMTLFAVPDEAFPEEQMQLGDEEPSQPSLPGNVNVNERQFLE